MKYDASSDIAKFGKRDVFEKMLKNGYTGAVNGRAAKINDGNITGIFAFYHPDSTKIAVLETNARNEKHEIQFTEIEEFYKYLSRYGIQLGICSDLGPLIGQID